jgi:hypothetical protein
MGQPNPKYIRLIQRLVKPRIKKNTSHAFGGGLLNGGFTPEAMELLQNVFEFDYMGAAEFEFGGVPQALNSIAIRASEFINFSLTIRRDKIALNPEREWPLGPKALLPPIPEKSATVYILCHAQDKEWVKPFVKKLAKNPYSLRLKENAMLNYSLDPLSEHDSRYVGWLELAYGFMFFTDKEMFEQTLSLFGLTNSQKCYII